MADDFGTLGRILVIIPTYNEIENVDMITGRLRASVPEADILIADDDSPDGTGKRADELAASDDHIKVLHRRGKEGLTAAYLASFRWGLEAGYDVLVEFDADGSHQPEELPKLLAALEHADMVKGSRWVKGGRVVNWSKSRELLSRGGCLYTQALLGLPVKDVTGGLNLFKRATLEAIIDDVKAGGYGIQRDLTWLAYRKGFTIVEVPIEFVERERGASKMGSDVVIEALKNTTQMGLAYRGTQAKSAVRKAAPVVARAGRDAAGLAVAASKTAARTVSDLARGGHDKS